MISAVARVVAGLIALVAWTGLAVQFRASLSDLGDVATTLWTMLVYFTVIANLLVAVVMTGVALGSRRLSAPAVLGGVTVTILLVGVVYGLLLRGLLELSGGARLADLLNHSVTPLLVPLYWLFLAPKGGLRDRDPLFWSVLPVVYYLYAMVRGGIEGAYAYPFMNVAKNGWPQTIGVAVVMAIGFLVTGFGLRWVDGRLGRGKVV